MTRLEVQHMRQRADAWKTEYRANANCGSISYRRLFDSLAAVSSSRLFFHHVYAQQIINSDAKCAGTALGSRGKVARVSVASLDHSVPLETTRRARWLDHAINSLLAIDPRALYCAHEYASVYRVTRAIRDSPLLWGRINSKGLLTPTSHLAPRR